MTILDLRLGLLLIGAIPVVSAAAPDSFTYKLLATTRPSTMEKEMNEAASAGFTYAGLVGGNTSFGGREILVVMEKALESPAGASKIYKVLEVNSSSALERKLDEAGSNGFEYRANGIFQHGSNDVVVIMGRDVQGPVKRFSYKLLKDQKTSSMDKDLQMAGRDGYLFLGVTLTSSFLAGEQVVSILGKEIR